MTATPSWLYYLFAVAMLAVAAYGLVLLAVSVVTRRTGGRDVDIAHIFMGVSMAGMFVADWAFGPSVIWELIFTVLLVWFVVQSIQSVIAFGIHLTHYLIHAAMSFAMLLMYVFPAASPFRSHVNVNVDDVVACENRSRAQPAVGVRVLRLRHLHARLAEQGCLPSRHARPGLRHEWGGGRDGGRSRRAGPSSTGRGAVRLITDPRLEDASHVVMAVGMGFMLILMI